VAVTALGVVSLVLPLSAGASGTQSSGTATTYIAPAVYQAAEKSPRKTIHVIIQNASGTSAAEDSFKTTGDAVEAVEKQADTAEKDAQQAADEQQKATEEAQKAGVEADQASAKARRAAKKAAAKLAREAERAARQAERAAKQAELATQRAAVQSQRARELAAKRDRLGSSKLGELRDKLDVIGAISVEIPAGWVYELERLPGLTVTLDAEVEVTAFSAKQLWAHQNGAAAFWGTPTNPGPKPPTIAIVDSGIEKGLLSFGDGHRIIDRQVFTSLPQDGSKDDGRGHGTFVSGIAAGEAPGYTGVAPRADLVDLDVMDDRGMARTSDVIKACEWILQNKESKNIRVANFSLHSSSVLSIRHHPLNKAVEKLWFGGVVVVAAAGNYGTPTGPSGVKHAPGNDPFVITVGAYDLEGSARIQNHDVPSWSAYGYTNEGFAKPDVVAAGRYIVGPAPVGATMGVERPDRIVAPGYLKLSGTSFAAPIVSGMAAQILARKPTWTPDQVKGAIMMSGRRMPDATLLEQGRGEVNLVRALAYTKAANPNAGLNRFVVADPAGGLIFDGGAFYTAVTSDVGWDAAAWQDAAWSSAAWQDAAWQDAAWQDAAWQDAAWQDAAWQDSTSYEDNVEGEPAGAEEVVDSIDAEALASDPELAVPGAETPAVPAVEEPAPTTAEPPAAPSVETAAEPAAEVPSEPAPPVQ
jgi:serine protease AprX